MEKHGEPRGELQVHYSLAILATSAILRSSFVCFIIALPMLRCGNNQKRSEKLIPFCVNWLNSAQHRRNASFKQEHSPSSQSSS